MKYVILILVVSLIAIQAHGQTIHRDSSGNYKEVYTPRSYSKPTGHTFTDRRGNTYPVLISTHGKLFVIRKSKKTGKEYREYLKIDSTEIKK